MGLFSPFFSLSFILVLLSSVLSLHWHIFLTFQGFPHPVTILFHTPLVITLFLLNSSTSLNFIFGVQNWHRLIIYLHIIGINFSLSKSYVRGQWFTSVDLWDQEPLNLMWSSWIYPSEIPYETTATTLLHFKQKIECLHRGTYITLKVHLEVESWHDFSQERLILGIFCSCA